MDINFCIITTEYICTVVTFLSASAAPDVTFVVRVVSHDGEIIPVVSSVTKKRKEAVLKRDLRALGAEVVERE